MIMNKKTISAFFAFTLCFFSCVSASAKSTKESIGKAKLTDNSKKAVDEPSKIQPEFQNEFARQLAAAGPGSEGWALFSDSPMGHNGQRWIIKTGAQNKETYRLCFIAQQDSKCVQSDLSKNQFESISPTLQAGDKLNHLLPTAFDTTSFEYLHAKNSTPHTIRVVFIRSANPFPVEYDNLIKAFNGLGPKK